MNISRISGNVGFNGLIRLANRDNLEDQRLLDTDNIRQIIQRNDDIIMINTKDDKTILINGLLSPRIFIDDVVKAYNKNKSTPIHEYTTIREISNKA